MPLLMKLRLEPKMTREDERCEWVLTGLAPVRSTHDVKSFV